jgi:hypothetical protein
MCLILCRFRDPLDRSFYTRLHITTQSTSNIFAGSPQRTATHLILFESCIDCVEQTCFRPGMSPQRVDTGDAFEMSDGREFIACSFDKNSFTVLGDMIQASDDRCPILQSL